ncbi:MAG: DUF2956 family protein [Candidatus Methylumidiphilus sp.]
MAQPNKPSLQEQAEQRLQEEALRVAKSVQTPGQTKEQTKLIAKGIEKGIALYKQQQKAKAREFDKARKKALRQKSADAGAADAADEASEFAPPSSSAQPALYAASAVFALAALFHVLRYWLGWRLSLQDFEIPLSWSLAAAVAAAALAGWMFRSAQD